jgi:hypothetical protein
MDNNKFKDVEHLQQQLKRDDKKWKILKKTSQKVKLANDYELQKKGGKIGLVC